MYTFDPGTGELTRHGRRRRLEPQPAKLLALLLAHRGELVSRERVRAALWDDATHVDVDSGIAYCLRQVRGALGDDGSNPRFVETLPKRGYRFIAPIAAEPADASAAASGGSVGAADPRGTNVRALITLAVAGVAAAGIFGLAQFRSRSPAEHAPPSPRPIVAVARFDNETGDPAYELWTAAAADAAVDRLTELGPERLGVIGNASVLRIPRDERDLDAIRAATGASHVVLGQLQSDVEGLRLLVHLIRLDDGTHLWATRLTRPTNALAGAEDEAASQLVAAVRERLLLAERPPQTAR